MKTLLTLSLLLTPALASAEQLLPLHESPLRAPAPEYLTVPKENSISKLLKLQPELRVLLCVERLAPKSKVTYETLVELCRKKQATQPVPPEHLGY